MLHAILIMHPQVEARTVVALMHDVRKRMAKGSMLVALTIVPCVAKGCADVALLEQELQKKDGDEYMEICDPIVSSDVGSGGEEGTAAAADPWTTWRASLANVLSKSIHGDHVLRLGKVELVVLGLAFIGAGRRARHRPGREGGGQRERE